MYQYRCYLKLYCVKAEPVASHCASKATTRSGWDAIFGFNQLRKREDLLRSAQSEKSIVVFFCWFCSSSHVVRGSWFVVRGVIVAWHRPSILLRSLSALFSKRLIEAFTDLEILWKFSWKYYFQWNFSWFMDSWKRRRLEIRALSSDCWPDEGGV